MDRMGYEGKAYIGVAGSTGSSELVGSRDITYKLDPERGDTTKRGDGSAPPIKTGRVAQRVVSIEITMVNDDSDTLLEQMRVAAYSGGPLALRTKDYASGKGFDGDVTLTCGHPYPLNGEQVITFTCEPTAESGRAPQLYV